MEYAYSETKVKIKASDADYGKFTCLECNSLVGLRKTYRGKKFHHFYHIKLKDPHCKLSYYENNWVNK
jgi:hypothetical protein